MNQDQEFEIETKKSGRGERGSWWVKGIQQGRGSGWGKVGWKPKIDSIVKRAILYQ